VEQIRAYFNHNSTNNIKTQKKIEKRVDIFDLKKSAAFIPKVKVVKRKELDEKERIRVNKSY
jgi:hypothetical protein